MLLERMGMGGTRTLRVDLAFVGTLTLTASTLTLVYVDLRLPLVMARQLVDQFPGLTVQKSDGTGNVAGNIKIVGII